MILLNTSVEPTAYSELFNYGVLGAFAVLMLFGIKWLVQYINTQNEKMNLQYIEQAKQLNEEKKALVNERDELNESFINHLKGNEGKFLEIITENSKAFNAVADSNENVADAVSLLVKSIDNRNNTTADLDKSIKELIHKKN